MNLLVKRARSGDKEAFVQLMEESKLSLLAAARAILKDEEDVADAMQETVLTAFQKLCTLREEKYFKTWLIRILINHCYTILRRRKTVPLSDFLPEESKENNWDDILDVRTALEETSAGRSAGCWASVKTRSSRGWRGGAAILKASIAGRRLTHERIR